MTPQKHRSPAFQFYADDFLAGTMDLSQSDVGAYIRLLCYQWSRGSIPVETEKQQRLAGGSISADVLSKFRLQPDGRLLNERLENERMKQAEYRELQSKKGKLSVESRKNQPDVNRQSTAVQPNTQPDAKPKFNSPSPSPSPSPSTLPTPIPPLPPSPPLSNPEASAGASLVQNEASAVLVSTEASKTPEHGKAAQGGGSKKRAAPMRIPTLEEVKLHALEIGLPETEAFKFFNHYESIGWRVGRNPMRAWTNTIANWKVNYDERRTGPAGPHHGRADSNPPAIRSEAGMAGIDAWRDDFKREADNHVNDDLPFA